MRVSTLLRFLLTRCFSMGIVATGGGGAAVLDEDDPEVVDTDAGEDDAAGDAEDGEGEGGGESGEGEGDETDEVVITIGEEAPAAEEEDESQAKPWVRELRKSHREQARRIRELEQQVGTAAPATQVAALGAKPKLEDCDYDTEKFERELDAWHQRKLAVDTETAKKQSAAEAEKKAWDARLEHHGKLKSALKVKDYDDAEAAVETALNVTQRGLIVHGADNSAQVNYALGKNPKTLKELAAITDPVKFAFAVAKLETKLKVTPRKNAPLPERVVRGNASPSGVVDSQLERLRTEADKTGDRTKVVKYMNEQKEKAKKRG